MKYARKVMVIVGIVALAVAVIMTASACSGGPGFVRSTVTSRPRSS